MSRKDKTLVAWSADFFSGLPKKRVEGPYGLRISVPRSEQGSCIEMASIVLRLLVLHGIVEGDGPKHLQKLEVYRGTEPEAMHIMVISTNEKEANDE